MELKQCRTCGETMPYDEFYYYISEKTGKIRYSSPDCMECHKELERIYRRNLKEEEGTGSNKIPQKPNKYADKFQKEQTFKFLTLLGWKFNEQKGIWYDNIKKTENGEFIGVWTPKRKLSKLKKEKPIPVEIEPVKEEIVIEGKKDIRDIYIPSTSIIRKKHFKKKKVSIDQLPKFELKKSHPIFTPELITKIQLDYYQNGLKFYEVVEKYKNYGSATVAYIIRRTMSEIKIYENKIEEH